LIDPITGRFQQELPHAYAAAGAVGADAAIAPESDVLAQAAIAPIEHGMIVGLGTGRTSSRAIRALARRVQAEHVEVTCVCTSMASEGLARGLGLRVVPFADVESVDYLFDGADEVDHQLRTMKGQHGAITRQRLVADVARRCVYLSHEDKLVDQLGSRALLAVIVIPFGIASTRARLRNLGLSGVVRRNMEGEVVVTDGGGVVLDMHITGRNVEQLALDLDHVPGVVDHGLFLSEADEILLEAPDASVRRLTQA
jgi:ribose 5-phosphate isomerase A